MNWIDIAWPMMSAGSATLGAIHFAVWFNRRDQVANLMFAITALSVAASSVLELFLMQSQSPDQYETLNRWMHLPIVTLVLGIIGFVLLQFRAGNRHLAAAAALTRIACLFPNFMTGANLNVIDVGRLQQSIIWGGASISLPVDAIANPWMILGHINIILLTLFVVSAMMDIWRRNSAPERTRALIICFCMIFFIVAAGEWSWAVVHGHVRGPYMFTPAFLFVVISMGYELGHDLMQANKLARGLSDARHDLVDSERKMDLAVQAGNVGLWSWDISTGYLWLSEHGALMLGWEFGSATNMDVLVERIHPEDLGRFNADLLQAGQPGGTYRGEYRVLYPEGNYRWIAMRGQIAADTGLTSLRLDGAFIDISQRKEAEDRFRLVLETAPTAMLLFDLTGKLVLANPRAASLFGFTTDEFSGMSADQLMHGRLRADLAQEPKSMTGLVAMNLAGSECELSGLHKDGAHIPLSVSLNPIPMESELFVLAAVTDLTHKNQLEHELALQRDELAHLSRVAMLAELSGSLAHELNQPLTAILANAQGATRFLARDPPDLDEVRNSLLSIVESDKRAGEVIRRLRALLRKDRTEFRYQDVNEVVTGVLKIIRSDLLNRHIETVLELADGLPMVWGDTVQLQQVLLNLIMNASDAMNGAGECEITIRTAIVSGQLVVSVSDVGRGIPEQELENIFTPFVSTKQDGLGLGLAVCKTIITAHQGVLWAANNEGSGATLSFGLPLHFELEQPTADNNEIPITGIGGPGVSASRGIARA